MSIVRMPQLPQEGVRDIELNFPDGWDVEVCNMVGRDRTALTKDEIRAGLHNPLGKPALRELAQGKKEVAIIFDDASRGAKWHDFAHAILEDLAAAGIPDESIRFICALGAHGTLNRTDFIRKLGEDIVSRYIVVNHNAFTAKKYIGTTSTWGTKIEINEELMHCDLKIGLGAVVPHPIAGFGGGSKIILPGVVSFDTIYENHVKSFEAASSAMSEAMKNDTPPKIGLGVYDDVHPVTDESDEAADLAGLDFLIDIVVNSRGEAVAMWAGDFRRVFAAGMVDARENYKTKRGEEKDIVIANAFYKNSEPMIALASPPSSLKREGGSVVLIMNCPEGMVTHYYVGPWGKFSTGPDTIVTTLPPYVDHLILYNEYPHPGSYFPIEPTEKVISVSKWDEVIALLKQWHGNKASAVVYPNADIQYMPAK